MRRTNPSSRFLTGLKDRLGGVLTLISFSVFSTHAFSANDLPTSLAFTGMPTSYSAEETEDHDKRLQSLADYATKQLPHLMPGLPDELRRSAKWALGQFEDSEKYLTHNLIGQENLSAAETLLHPIAGILQPAPPHSEGVWLAPAYHHRGGVSPRHDALQLGVHSRHNFIDRYLILDLHPYVGQNYFSASNYYGSEVALDLASPSDTSSLSKPWGRIVLNYANGDDVLLDRGRGVDLRGELRFNDHLTLNTGMRQSDKTGGSDYVLLQWKLTIE